MLEQFMCRPFGESETFDLESVQRCIMMTGYFVSPRWHTEDDDETTYLSFQWKHGRKRLMARFRKNELCAQFKTVHPVSPPHTMSNMSELRRFIHDNFRLSDGRRA